VRSPMTMRIRWTAAFSGSGKTYSISIGAADGFVNLCVTSTSPTKPVSFAFTSVCSSGSVRDGSATTWIDGTSPGSVKTGNATRFPASGFAGPGRSGTTGSGSGAGDAGGDDATGGGSAGATGP